MNILKFLGLTREKSAEEIALENKRKFEILVHDGKLAMSIGELKHATSCFSKALDIEDNLEVLKYLAEAYVKFDDYSNTYQTLERILTFEPNNVEVLLLQTQMAYYLNNYQGMTDLCQSIFLIDSTIPQTYYLLAQANHAMHDNTTAVAMLTKTIMLKDDLYEAYLMRAKILLEMQQYKEAEQDIDFLIEKVGEHEDFFYLKGLLYAHSDDVYNASMAFDKTISINPFYQNAYVAKIKLYLEHNKPEEALNIIERSIEIYPELAQLYKLRSDIKHQNGDEKGALEDLKHATKLDAELTKQVKDEFSTLQQRMDEQYKAQNPYGF